MEVTELEAEKGALLHISLSYRDVGGCGGFASSVARTATPKVKSQVSRRAYISYVCFGMYICVCMCTYTHKNGDKACLCNCN